MIQGVGELMARNGELRQVILPADEEVWARAENELPATRSLELSVIVPTLNERDNVPVLLERLDEALSGTAWEVIFVDDDSVDGTAEAVRQIAATDPRVRCLHRIGRRGLASACIEGMLASAAPYLAVIDADMQHDEKLLSRMLDVLKRDEADLVIGSRYMERGCADDWSRSRKMVSRVAERMSRTVMKAEVSDPMSGFFMLRRDVFNGSVRKLSGIGFKILLDILTSSSGPLRIRELPYKFGMRSAGESKLDATVAWEYVMMLLDKMIGHIVPVRFLLFSLIGLLGLAVHLSVLAIAFQGGGLGFAVSQTLATFVAMTNNFLLNNVFTYRDIRLRGWSLGVGLLSFYLVCSVGALANIGIATYVYGAEEPWWIAGVAGAIIGAVWNYAVSSVYTWRKPKVS
jgi:dolichol-phosphate mannosyltransferase